MPESLAGLSCNFIKKEILEQVFSCEFCEISENTFSTEHLRTTPSDVWWQISEKVPGYDDCFLISLFSWS